MHFPVPPIHELPLALRWTVERLAPEDVVKGWVAGPCVRVTTHWSGSKTTPCVKAMTMGKLPCMCDGKRMVSRVVGYMPFLQTDGDRSVLLVSEKVAQKLMRLPHATAIQVTRPKSERQAFKVKQLNSDELSTTMQKMVFKAGPQDIKPYLLHLWQNTELTTHFAAEFYPSNATIMARAKQEEEAA